MLPYNPLYMVTGSGFLLVLAILSTLVCLALGFFNVEIGRGGRMALFAVPLFLMYASGRLYSAEVNNRSLTLYEVSPLGGSREPYMAYLDWQSPGEIVIVGLVLLSIVTLYGAYVQLSSLRVFLAAALLLMGVTLATVFTIVLGSLGTISIGLQRNLASVERALCDVLFVSLGLYALALLCVAFRYLYRKVRAARPPVVLPAPREALEGS